MNHAIAASADPVDPTQTYRVLIVGDATPVADESAQQGPVSSAFRRFSEDADTVVLSLSTPAPDLTDTKAEELAALGIDAISLARPSAGSADTNDIETTSAALNAHGIQGFGAGGDLETAQSPHRIVLPSRLGGGEVHLHAAADAAAPKCAPLGVANTAPARTVSTPTDSLQVALPTWTVGQRSWRTQRQFALSHRLLANDYDLVLGHGAAGLQEVIRTQQRWVVYGIGNGLSNSSSDIPPTDQESLSFSFWTVLEVHAKRGHRWVEVKLYPISTNPSAPGPVDGSQFDRVIRALSERPERSWRFANPAMSTGEDELGHYIALQAGDWPVGQRFARLEPSDGDGDAGDWLLRSPGIDLEDKVLGLNKHLGAAMMAIAAENEGGTTFWLNRDLGLIECRGKRLLSFRYRNHESSLGAVLVGDKVLTARILEKAGVPTPATYIVKNADEAVDIAQTITGPVVIKPRFGVKSMGVSTGLVTNDEVREAFDFARDNGTQVILQPHINFTEELRVMAAPDQAMAVNGRALPHVIGDGASTIGALIADKNLQRTLNPSLEGRPIPIDALTHRQLSRLGLTIDAVPKLGERVTVRNVAGLSVGGDTIQALDETPEEIKAVAAGAVSAIPGLGWGGADVIIEDSTQRPYVIEINTQAAYGAALFPAYGEPKDVGADAWRLRYEATAIEPTEEPETAEPLTAPEPLVRDTILVKNDSPVAFRRLFLDALKRLPHQVRRPSQKIREVLTPRGWVLVTRSGLTAADRFVVEKAMSRLEWIHRILVRREIARVPGRVVTTTAQLRRFLDTHPGAVSLRPARTPWSGPHSHLMSEDSLAKAALSSGRSWVQARPAGRRVRVLASHHRAETLVAHRDEQPLSSAEIADAGRLAVWAVRSIPELRWAAVDIVVTGAADDTDSTDRVLVEGLSQTPDFSLDDEVIAGGLDTFCQWIVEAEDVPASDQPTQ